MDSAETRSFAACRVGRQTLAIAVEYGVIVPARSALCDAE